VVRAILVGILVSAAVAAQPLTLEQAVKLGLDRNPDLRKQVLLALSAEQDKVLARANVLPRIDFNASAGGTRQGAGTLIVQGIPFPEPSSGYSTGAASLTLRQLVFDGGKWWNNLDSADLNLASNKAQVDEQRLQITYLIEQRFYELVRAQRQLQVLSEAAQRSRDQADFTQRLYEGGRATQADVYAARANRDNDEITRLGQERTVELAREDLAAAIGLDPSEPLTVAEPQRLFDDPAQPPAAGEAVQRAIANRPSLKAFALTAEANRKAYSAAHGDYWPVVSLNGSWVRGTRDDFGPLLRAPGRDSQASATVNLSWNFFNGLATNANVRKAEIQVLLSENDLATGRRSVASDVEKAVAQLSTARAQARVATQTEQTAKEGLRLARTRQEVGVGTQLEVRDAELKLTQAQLTRVGSLVDGREAEAALRRAQGDSSI
jgi:outer membrane protein TolC